MLLKRILVVSVVASLGVVIAACSDDAGDACEHLNEICASKEGFQKADCSKAEAEYDKLSDSDKEKSDKVIECIMDKDSCDDAIKCALSGG
jgi:hypothetical protein